MRPSLTCKLGKHRVAMFKYFEMLFTHLKQILKLKRLQNTRIHLCMRCTIDG